MPHYNYILFDFDGTLADSKAVVLSLYNELAERKGYARIDSHNINTLRTLGIKERCKALGVPLYKIPFIVAHVLKQYNKAIHHLTFNEGIKEMLAGLDEKAIPYAIASSNAAENIKAFFNLQGAKCPEVYTSSKIFGKDRLLKKFLTDNKLLPQQVLYVGDEARDIMACRECGIPVAWVSWGYDAPEAVSENQPDFILNAPAEIFSLL